MIRYVEILYINIYIYIYQNQKREKIYMEPFSISDFKQTKYTKSTISNSV